MMSKSKASNSGTGSSGSGGEDVLLYMKHVRHKKSNGGLFLLPTRLGWMEEERDNKMVANIHYADIKMQKISAAGKVKVQLQIVLHNGESATFHFNNPTGYDAQVSDREKVKDMLQQMIPKFRSQVDQDLKRKLQALQADPKLLQLYKDLVAGNIIPAEEFWQNVASDSLKGPGGTGGGSDEEEDQDMGVASGFLAEVKPQSHGTTHGIRYSITRDVISAVFKTYPAVKVRHAEHVPANMTETEFWTRFFESHYFHRDRIVDTARTRDIFDDCARTDELIINKALFGGMISPHLG